jgi:protein phosphatase
MELEKAVNNANDQISQQNDRENRQGRRRMGTTLVMGLHVGNEMYITHVGDSRAYLITLQGCYQVTLDDDVASREVCLGHTLYREATHKNDAGSLIQALGMSPSIFLNPTAQSLILDEDSVFLLCSDGLSDFDRVEENWETEILPLLMNKLEINDVADTLVRIANSYNGHDNVTVAVIHCQVKHSEPVNHINTEFVNTTPIDKSTVLRTEQQSYLSTIISERGSKQKHQAETIGNFSRRRFKMLLQLLVIFPLVIMAFMLGLSIWKIMNPYPQISIGTSKPVLFKKPRTVENLQLGWVVRTTQRTALTERKSVSTNTLLQVIDKKPGVLNSGGINIRFRVCPSSIQSSSDNDTLFWVNINQLKEAKVKVLQAGEISPCNPLPIIVVPAS